MRWLARSALLAVALAALAYLPVWALSEAGAFGDEPISSGEYGYVLIFCAFGWPFYMWAISSVSRRGLRFRRWAIALSPIIGLPLTIGILFVNVPEILAGWIFWLSFGATVSPRPAHLAGTRPRD